MNYVIELLLVIQITILVYFIIQSTKQRLLFAKHVINPSCEKNCFDVIIAAREDINLTMNCIDNVQKAGFNNIILCIDGNNDSTASILKKQYPLVTIINNQYQLGKISSQIKCLSYSSNNKVLILDADITLDTEEINQFISYYNESGVDFLCPYSAGVSNEMDSLLFSIVECDRYMRQRIVRAGRDAFGVSNLSGYCMLADKEKYVDIIDSTAIQDDVMATINLLNKGYTVKTYHKVVCFEFERTTFYSLLMQKTRWTAGYLMLTKSYSLLFKSTSLSKIFAFMSSSLLWYWALWIDFIAAFVALFNPGVWIFLSAEFLAKFVGLTLASSHKNRYFSNIVYIFFWPLFSILCLILSPLYLTGKIAEQKSRR